MEFGTLKSFPNSRIQLYYHSVVVRSKENFGYELRILRVAKRKVNPEANFLSGQTLKRRPNNGVSETSHCLSDDEMLV